MPEYFRTCECDERFITRDPKRKLCPDCQKEAQELADTVLLEQCEGLKSFFGCVFNPWQTHEPVAFDGLQSRSRSDGALL